MGKGVRIGSPAAAPQRCYVNFGFDAPVEGIHSSAARKYHHRLR